MFLFIYLESRGGDGYQLRVGPHFRKLVFLWLDGVRAVSVVESCKDERG